jgi:prevent-host-death family protein
MILYKTGAAMITVTVSEAREKMADLLGRVQFGQEDVTILKHGKPVAVMISPEAMAHYEALEDAELSKMAQDILDDPNYDPNDVVPAEEVFAAWRAENGVE